LWKKRADETMREKARKEERRRQQEEESKKEKEKLKHERAESSFHAWKKKKDLEIKKNIKENKLVHCLVIYLLASPSALLNFFQ